MLPAVYHIPITFHSDIRSHSRTAVGLGQPLRDGLGDPVAHRDAVEGVGHLHGPFLVGDDDELAGAPQLGENLQQPPQVRVVQGRLDLVHDIEGRGPCLEDRHQQGHGGQRALPA